jgi:hypothetical protein
MHLLLRPKCSPSGVLFGAAALAAFLARTVRLVLWANLQELAGHRRPGSQGTIAGLDYDANEIYVDMPAHTVYPEIVPKQTVESHLSKHDREIAAIRKLIVTGMKLVVETQRAQRKTEQTLERFIRSLERGTGNGHTKAGRVQ